MRAGFLERRKKEEKKKVCNIGLKDTFDQIELMSFFLSDKA